MKVETLTVGTMQENCYLIIDENTNKAALIDPRQELIILKNNKISWSRFRSNIF